MYKLCIYKSKVICDHSRIYCKISVMNMIEANYDI